MLALLRHQDLSCGHHQSDVKLLMNDSKATEISVPLAPRFHFLVSNGLPIYYKTCGIKIHLGLEKMKVETQ